ncbi:thermonuclease family protein [Leucobacter sp. HNU]|uniref:thermonuclease family protein n=1 Tax=Leucobacter sp. HNU TaxID=3236805 RepID=UPI003A7FE7D9
MKLTLIAGGVLFLCAIVAMLIPFTLGVKPPAWKAEGKPTSEVATVEYVVDGDTIAVTRDGRSVPERVRLIGIDTPELGHGKGPDECWAVEARDMLRGLLPKGTKVALYPDPSQASTDKYGRLLRHVFTGEGTPDRSSVALYLLAMGAGPEHTYDTPYAGQAEYRHDADLARTNQLGYWHDCQ